MYEYDVCATQMGMLVQLSLISAVGKNAGFCPLYVDTFIVIRSRHINQMNVL